MREMGPRITPDGEEGRGSPERSFKVVISFDLRLFDREVLTPEYVLEKLKSVIGWRWPGAKVELDGGPQP